MKSPLGATANRNLLQKLAQNSLKVGLRARSSLRRESSLYEVFHENTKLGRLTTRAYSAWIVTYTRMRRDRTPLESGKVYTLMERRALPRVEARTELERTIAARRSVREFTGAAIDLEDLSRILLFTYGKTERRGRLRAVASGGALYPLELYVVALKVEGLEPGLYHYGADSNHLDVVKAGDWLGAFKELVNCYGIEIEKASVAVVVTAAFPRSTVKYLDRGYRMVLMEAGEVAQNLCLLTTSMGLGTCLLGGFNDDLLSEFLDVDGVEEAPLLAMVVGRHAAAKGSADARASELTVST